MIVELAVVCLVVVGSVFSLIGSFGLARLPDFYTRLHGPTKATTLGVGALILASILYFSVVEGAPNLQELLVIFFLFLTAPVSAHLLARAALVREVHSVTGGSDTAAGHKRPDHQPGADEPERVDIEADPLPTDSL